jgi:hypothetical protein
MPFYDVMPAKAGIQYPRTVDGTRAAPASKSKGYLIARSSRGDDTMGYALCGHGHYWPILNVKSPLTLCVSADTAFHSTL